MGFTSRPRNSCCRYDISSVKWDPRNCHSPSQESPVSKTFGTFLDRLQVSHQLDWIVFDECHTVLNSPKMRQFGEMVEGGGGTDDLFNDHIATTYDKRIHDHYADQGRRCFHVSSGCIRRIPYSAGQSADFRSKMCQFDELIERGVQMIYLTATLPPHTITEFNS